MKLLINLLLMITLASCGGLPVDSTPAPIDNGLRVLEMSHEGNKALGLFGTTFDLPGERYFEIPLWHKGSFNIRSKRCNYELAQSFKVKGFSSQKFFLKDLLEKMPNAEFACVFNVQLFIDGMDKGMQGQFYLLKEESDFEYITTKIFDKTYDKGITYLQMRENGNTNTEITFLVRNKGTFFFQGCGRTDEMKFDGEFSIPLKFIVGEEPEECLYTLGFEFDDGTTGLNEFNFKTFKKEVLQLARPVISYKLKILRVSAIKPVGFVAINSKYKKGLKVRKRLKPTEMGWVRYVTANGRYGLLGVKNGRIVWTPSLVY